MTENYKMYFNKDELQTLTLALEGYEKSLSQDLVGKGESIKQLIAPTQDRVRNMIILFKHKMDASKQNQDEENRWRRGITE